MNYYYTFIKADQFITISGSGNDPHNLDSIEWISSPGATGVLEQLDSITNVYAPTVGFVSVNDYKNNMYVQIAKFGSIYKDGWRFDNTNLPPIHPVGDKVEE